LSKNIEFDRILTENIEFDRILSKNIEFDRILSEIIKFSPESILSIRDEKGADWRMMRRLFRNVVRATSVLMLPKAAECFAQNGIKWLLQSLRLLVETRQVPLDNEFHSVEWIVLQHRLGNDVGMIKGIGKFVEKGTRLENECRQDDLGEIHAGTDLLHEEPDQRFVFFGKFFDLFTGLRRDLKV
jgi:hypothetical protein